MKTSKIAILVVVLVFMASVCPAAYVIRLKDGRSFETPEYQTEGDQIKFKRYGGLIGLPRNQILEIEEIDAMSEEEIVHNRQKSPVFETGRMLSLCINHLLTPHWMEKRRLREKTTKNPLPTS
jgi:hypothetical protein